MAERLMSETSETVDLSENVQKHIDEVEVLDEFVVEENGPISRLRSYINGHHPDRGVVTGNGWSEDGQETIIETMQIKPALVINVVAPEE